MSQPSQDEILKREKYLYLLLDIVLKNGSMRRLTREGIEFSGVALITDQAIDNKLLFIEGGRELKLTDAGIKLLEDLKPKYKNYDKNAWIEKAKKSRIARLDKKAIFVPNQNELTFRQK